MMRDTDAARAKDSISNYVGKLVMTPVERDGRRMYRVSGSVSVPPDWEGAASVVCTR